jgi:hypothetical protein
VVNVPTLARQDAVQMIKLRLQQDQDASETDFDRPCSELEDLPLAIAQATEYMVRGRYSVARYLRLWEETRQDVTRSMRSAASKYHNALAEAWIITFGRIQQENLLACEYLSFMSCLDPDQITESLLPQASDMF